MNRSSRLYWAASVSTAFALTAALPRTSEAQIAVPRPGSERPRVILGGDIILTQPRRELADYIDNGWGGNLGAMVRLEREGLLHVRFDGGSARYGSDDQRFTYAGREYIIATTNNIDWFALGPQVMVPGGPIRPYVNAAVSLTRFRTTSTLRYRQFGDDVDLATEDNASDFTTGWVFGGGFYVPFGLRSALSLNIGARYHFGGEANFVREEDVRDAPIESSTFPSSRSKADFVLWQLGLSYALPMGGGGIGVGR